MGLSDLLAAQDDRTRTVGGRAGLAVPDRVPQHRRLDDLFEGEVGLVEMGIRVVQRMLAVLEGHHATDQLGRFRHHHVAADDRTEIAAGAGVDRRGKRLRQRERPHRVGLRLLLPADREHGLVHTGLDHRRGDACGGTTD